MIETMAELSLTTTRVIRAPAEKVFKAWLTPATLKRFMIPCEGGSVPLAESDAREGGRFRIVMFNGEKDIPHSGTYRVVDPYKRIVFTWESPFSLDDSTVTIDLKPLGESETELTLTHVKFRDEGARDGHLKGWNVLLDSLQAITL